MTTARGWTWPEWADRVKSLLGDARYVNLGVGLPTKLGDRFDDQGALFFHCENGLIGTSNGLLDEADAVPELVDASGRLVSLREGSAIVDIDVSFGLMRGGHLDATVLGAFQVSQAGDLANWSSEDGTLSGVGGAMDLAVGCKKLLVMMHHVERDGTPKLVEALDLPLTARGCVEAVVTEYATITVRDVGFVVTEIATGISQSELQDLTGAPLLFSWEYSDEQG